MTEVSGSSGVEFASCTSTSFGQVGKIGGVAELVSRHAAGDCAVTESCTVACVLMLKEMFFIAMKSANRLWQKDGGAMLFDHVLQHCQAAAKCQLC